MTIRVLNIAFIGLVLRCLLPGSMPGQLLPPSHSAVRLPELLTYVEVDQDIIRRELVFRLIDLRDHVVIDSFYTRSVRWTTGRIDIGDSDQLAYRLWLRGGSNTSYEQLIILTVRNGELVTSLNLQSYERFFMGEFIDRQGSYFYGRDSVALENRVRNGRPILRLKQDYYCIENDKPDVRRLLTVTLRYDEINCVYYSEMIHLSATPDGEPADNRRFHAVKLLEAVYVYYDGGWYWCSEDMSKFDTACFCTIPF